jgi:hypothetical protein
VPHLLPENIESLFSRSKAFCKIDGLAVHHNERLDNQKAIKMTLKHFKTRLYPYYHICIPAIKDYIMFLMFDGYIILIKKVVDQPPSYPHKMVTYHILIYPVPFFYDHKKMVSHPRV